MSERFELDLEAGAQPESAIPHSPENSFRKTPVVVLVIGMAGSGKTTLMQRINIYMEEQRIRSYYINLDPAVKSVPFGANIDIRDTINYKEVMSQYGLGPNGGILTSLNLFSTRFDQVMGILEQRADDLDFVFIDTPGQIEVIIVLFQSNVVLISFSVVEGVYVECRRPDNTRVARIIFPYCSALCNRYSSLSESFDLHEQYALCDFRALQIAVANGRRLQQDRCGSLRLRRGMDD
jgi:nucleoside-triphosphatase THEP1